MVEGTLTWLKSIGRLIWAAAGRGSTRALLSGCAALLTSSPSFALLPGETLIPATEYWYTGNDDPTAYPTYIAAANAYGSEFCATALAAGTQGCFYTVGVSTITVVQVQDGVQYPTELGLNTRFTCPQGLLYQELLREPDGTLYKNVCYAYNPPPPPPPAPPKVIVIDPGHGYSCPAKGQAVGAVGLTDWPATNPPAGRLHEDDLTVLTGLEVERIMTLPRYKVILTKRDANSCPTFRERGRLANENRARLLVAIHFNAAGTLGSLTPTMFTGVSTFYSGFKPTSRALADYAASTVSSGLGMNNRGSSSDTGKAILSPNITRMDAVLVEGGRLSGSDETILHNPQSQRQMAQGIKTAIDSFLRGE